MEDYNTSISGGVLDVLNDICSDEPRIYTFSKTALQPIWAFELRRRNAACSTPLAFLELVAPRCGVQETPDSAMEWYRSNRKCLASSGIPGGDDTLTALYVIDGLGVIFRLLHSRCNTLYHENRLQVEV